MSTGKVALLLRKSKVVEEGTDALSIEAQEVKGRAWAANEGLEVVAVYRENVSGYKDVRRPEMERALSAMERGEFGTLWSAALDRLSRRGAIAVAGILANGGRFVFDWERLDSADPRDLRMILWRAEDAKEYSDRLSHNVRATKDRMRDAGAYVGAAPYGTRVGTCAACNRGPGGKHSRDPLEFLASRGVRFRRVIVADAE
ncbi:recombinase family protein [Actinomadura sp. NBRC 104412]|uniref:recombinase family protein n=1 Tax=Actinomadura sp. NBRC 104412 TaxID=3032203 RepID=UPI0025522CD4|nr:recombinase family protein [Actinomadura sp. NBRC 104412]